MSLNILHLSYSKSPIDGGITTAVSNLVDAQLKHGIQSSWLASDDFSPFPFGSSPLNALVQAKPDLVHIHGLWRTPTRIAPLLASKGIPYIVTPHGMLDSWALRNSKWKKQLVFNLWEKRVLSKAACIHAICAAEFQSIRVLFPHAPISVIPNGVDFQLNLHSNLVDTPPPWAGLFPNHSKVLLFFGRYHAKKGIQQLLSSWKQVCVNAKTSNWHLVFIGYGDDGALHKQVTHLKNKRQIENVHVLGPSFGVDRISAFLAADAFILPSFSEGLPMAAIEAMSFSTPCLLSTACNLQDAFECSAALHAEPDQQSLITSLLCLFSIPSEKLLALGSKGRDYVEVRFNWTRVCSDINDMYQSALGLL